MMDNSGILSSFWGNSSFSYTQPIMHSLGSVLLLGTFAVQKVLGLPGTSAHLQRRTVDSYVSSEGPIALQKLLCNIGSDGCEAQSAASGAVVASPSTSNPDCKKPARVTQAIANKHRLVYVDKRQRTGVQVPCR